MGAPEDFIRYFESRDGVQKVLMLDDGQFNEVWNNEKMVKTQTLSDYENMGFEVLSKRRSRFCLYVDDKFRLDRHSLLKMLDGEGKVIGTTIPPEDIPKYADRTDVVWLSKDFNMFPNLEPVGKERFVLYPYEFPELSDEIPGCVDVVGTSPAPSSDMILKRMGDMPIATRLFTFILGFDHQ